jgi:dsDNA-binding SOS-regulon protein
MQKDKIVDKFATLQLLGGTVLHGKITEQDDNGFWLAMSKDEIMKIVGQGAPPQENSLADVFIPFSSISWLKLED